MKLEQLNGTERIGDSNAFLVTSMRELFADADKKYTDGFDAEWIGAQKNDVIGWLDGSKQNPSVSIFRDAYESAIPASILTIENDISGAAPDVAAYCAGLPESMLYQCESSSYITPLRAWVNFSVWSKTSTTDAARAFAEIAKALYGISLARPVELHLFCISSNNSDSTGNIVAYVIPVDLSGDIQSVANAFNAVLYRAVLVHAQYITSKTNRQVYPCFQNNPRKSLDFIGAGQSDLYIPNFFDNERLLSDPAAEIRQIIESHNHAN